MPLPPSIKETIRRKAERQARKGLDPDVRVKTAAGWRFPVLVEKMYEREKVREIRLIEKLTKEMLIPLIPAMVEEVKLTDTRQDGYVEDFIRIFGFLKVRFGELITDIKIQRDAQSMATGVDKVGSKTFDAQVKSVLGVAPHRTEPWLSGTLNNTVTQNVSLIKTLHADTFKDIETQVLNGLQTGRSTKDIARSIAEKTGASKKRATLIARDQVGKLTSTLATRRASDLGAKRFEWQTSSDERVRPSHRALNGKMFTYKVGASVDGETGVLPGQPILCRCSARVVLSSLDESDSQAKKKTTSQKAIDDDIKTEKAREKEFRKERRRLKAGEKPTGLS
jgi:SPP1 gp7 family putative phage head morphogenesis protein